MADEIKTVVMEEKDFKALTDKLGTDANKTINTLFVEAEKGNKEAMAEIKAKLTELETIEGKSIKITGPAANNCSTQYL